MGMGMKTSDVWNEIGNGNYNAGTGENGSENPIRGEL